MMTFLFWNSKHAKGPLIGQIVAEHRADVLVLAESSVDTDIVLDEIEKADATRFAVDPQRENVSIFTRFLGSKLGLEYEERHLSIRRIPSKPEDMILVAVHLLSKTGGTSCAELAALVPG